MEGFDGHPGTSKLASVLSQRMKRENESPCFWILVRYRQTGA